MAKFTRIQVALTMKENGMVPVFFHKDIEVCKKVLKACYDGGARVFEFTNRGDQAAVVFKQILVHCQVKYPDLALGIGSISSVEQAEEYINMGAHFLVSPFINEDLAKTAKAHNILWTGGCGTLTEMQTAYSWGVPLLKLFPGDIYGPVSFGNSV